MSQSSTSGSPHAKSRGMWCAVCVAIIHICQSSRGIAWQAVCGGYRNLQLRPASASRTLARCRGKKTYLLGGSPHFPSGLVSSCRLHSLEGFARSRLRSPDRPFFFFCVEYSSAKTRRGRRGRTATYLRLLRPNVVPAVESSKWFAEPPLTWQNSQLWGPEENWRSLGVVVVEGIVGDGEEREGRGIRGVYIPPAQ